MTNFRRRFNLQSDRSAISLLPSQPGSRLKWGSVTDLVKNRPGFWRDIQSRIIPICTAPRAHDVFIGRVLELGRHKRLEISGGRRARLYVGDLVGVTFGHRYATRQYEGVVPGVMDEYDMLSQAGVCGQVVSASEQMREPTLIQPLGYLTDESGDIVNLRNLGRHEVTMSHRVPTIVVVGSSMDSGKTRTVSSIVHGLSAAGHTVHAGKLTGTACAKDVNEYRDAGAADVLDFAGFGFGSTFRSGAEELKQLTRQLVAALSLDEPDYLVLEIADGLIHSETQQVLDCLLAEQLADFVCLAVHDCMSAPFGEKLLYDRWRVRPTLISGVVTCSPLSTAEAAELASSPVITAEELCSPEIQSRFPTSLVSPGNVHHAMTDLVAHQL